MAIKLWEQYHLPRCWNTINMANRIYNESQSQMARINAIKEQIVIQYLGLGWKDAHHLCSAHGEVFNSHHLLKRLTEKVLPKAETFEILLEPPINFPTPPKMMNLGTESELLFSFKYANEEKIEQFKTSANAKTQSLEEEGIRDCWSAKQCNIMPMLDVTLGGLKSEMLFQYDTDDGMTFINWCNGVVSSIINSKSGYVNTKWNHKSLTQGDPETTRKKSLASKWNPNKAPKGSWREYFGEDK